MNIMKNKILAFVLALLALLAFTPGVAQAQTATLMTTLGAAQTGGRQDQMLTVASTSNMAVGGFVLVDSLEMERILVVVSSTVLTVQRDQGGFLTSHANGANVFYGLPGTYNNLSGNTNGTFISVAPQGKCTRGAATTTNLPVFSQDKTSSQYVPSDCVGGVWRTGTPYHVSLAPVRLCTEPIGSVAYASVGTSTATVAGTIYVSSIQIDKTRLVTGVSILNGATVGTDNLLGALYSNSGELLGSSALAGILSAGASAFQDLVFISPKLIVGPARYYVAMQGNGTTATIRLMAASTFVDVLADSRTGTFGTLPAITVPTTFTATKAPVACLY